MCLYFYLVSVIGIFSWLFYLCHSYINFVVQSLHDTHLKMVQIIVYTMSFCKFYKAEPRNESTYISFLWQNHLWFILILVSIFVVERNKPMFCLIVLFSTFLLDMREKLISRESWITFPHLPHSGLRISNYLTLTFENFFPTSCLLVLEIGPMFYLKLFYWTYIDINLPEKPLFNFSFH